MKKVIQGNGDKEVEHPKQMIEVIANTREAIEGYSATTKMSFSDAALTLIFNELRCIHWHYDMALAKEVEHASSGKD